MLHRFPEPLPGEWQARVDELAALHEEFEPAHVREVGFVGPNSPISRDELAAMSVEEMVAFLREWQPPQDSWRAPSREGLGRILRQLTGEKPERFAEGAGAFADVDPTYVQMMEFAGPARLHLGGPMMMSHSRTISFPAKGTYRIGTKTVEMPGAMDVKTIGPDNNLRLVVTVA